jgi:heme-degrading monooxygenase HmoA
MISRQWRGVAHRERGDAYLQHLRDATFPALRRLPGFIDASILRREVSDGVEFLIVTRWTSLDAIRTFAGASVEAAVVPEVVAAMMVDYDRVVRHYEVLA